MGDVVTQPENAESKVCPECNGRGYYQTEGPGEGGVVFMNCHVCGDGQVVPENAASDPRAFWRRDCERTDPHEPHRVEHREHPVDPTCDNGTHAFCRGEHHVWCYGVIAPDSLRGKLEALRPGQRVRVVLEGVVDEERRYGSDVEWPACSIRANDDMVVLRYTGKHPGVADYGDGGTVRGQLVGPVVDVEVIPDA